MLTIIEKTLFGEINKVEVAINRLKEFEPKDEPYILAFSGGKDSLVIYILAKMAGVKFKAVYTLTSVDPPELVWHIKKNYPDVEIIYPKESLFAMIERKMMPPTRLVRYCCDIKENTGPKGSTVILGVRAEESGKRAKQKMVSFFKGKIMVRPIIDWSTEDVWAFIRSNPQYPYCELYDRGWERIGCIGCPLSSNAEKELEMYPKYKQAYIRAFDRMIDRRLKLGKHCDWTTGQEVMDWWLQKNKKDKNLIPGQCDIYSQFEGI